jgi:protein TonB
MRIYTLLVSMVAHVTLVLAIVVVTLAAADVLPPVRRAIDFVSVVPPPPPPPPPLRRAPATPRPGITAVPLNAPDGIVDEPPTMPDDPGALTDPAIVSSGLFDGPPANTEPPPPPAPVPGAAVRVGGLIRPPMRLSATAPAYPELARSARVEGVVILEAVIAEDGSVREVRPLRSIPLLDQAAVDAVRRWRYTPTLLNGQPVAVVMTVTVDFRLIQ